MSNDDLSDTDSQPHENRFIHFLKHFKFSLSTNIVIGLVLGIFCGLFFGELCKHLAIVGEAFVRLLQMTVLPYIVVSLISGIGSLSVKNAKMLAIKGLLVLLLFWIISMSMLLLLPLAFPHIEQASFFSTSIVTPVKTIDLLDLYLPSNPFNSLANNVIPAVVFFCICIGVALIGIKEKESLLVNLRTLTDAITKVTHVVVKLTPIGVFSIAAAGAGTMTIHQFERLEVYFVTYIMASILMTFLIIPLIVMALTPFRYRDIVSISKDALITGFTTQNLLIIIPIVSRGVKELFAKYEAKRDDTDSLVNIVVPVYFNFPDSGKLLSLLFVLFASWFIGSPMSIWTYPNFAVTGLITFFGGVNIALPFLLNYFQLPTDLFQLYLVTGIINGNFSTMLATMDMFAFTLVCCAALTGYIRLSFSRIAAISVIGVVVTFCCLYSAKFILSRTVKKENVHGKQLLGMTLDSHVPRKVIPLRDFRDSWLRTDLLKRKIPYVDKIRERGILRVGFYDNSLPFAYQNDKKQLVGYDVAMAARLAEDLKCKLELVQVPRDQTANALNSGKIDIVMSGLVVNIQHFGKIELSDAYMTLNFAFIIKSNEKDRFRTVDSILRMKDLSVAVQKGSPFIDDFKSAFPDTKIEYIHTLSDFFSRKARTHVLVTSAERGSAWSLLHPEYTVVVPKPIHYKVDTSYAVKDGNLQFLYFINQWLKIQKLNRYTEKQYDYWILGKERQEEKQPRWCIIRNVLHWIK